MLKIRKNILNPVALLKAVGFPYLDALVFLLVLFKAPFA